jgi:hypothetical protein
VLEIFTGAFQGKPAGNALIGMLLTFIFLSQDAFVRPTPRVCGWQSIVCPGIYFFIFLNEAVHFHVAKTSDVKKWKRY